MRHARLLHAIAFLLLLGFATASTAHGQPRNLEPELARQALVAGNRRFVAFRLRHPDQTRRRLVEVSQEQHPFAAIVACADSRVPPEILFDEGLGDLFVVRLAGNIVDDAALASLEYAVDHLGVRLIVVLGHERCGALQAVLAGGELPGHMRNLAELLQPAVDAARRQPGDVLDRAVRIHVDRVVEQLSTTSTLRSKVQRGELVVLGGRYDLDDGTVELGTMARRPLSGASASGSLPQRQRSAWPGGATKQPLAQRCWST